MAKHQLAKDLLNCGRKRKMTLQEAKAQQKARQHETHDKIRIYLCDKCNTHHTTSKVNKIDWSKL